MENLQFETKSSISEASDSGMGTERAPSELDVDIGGQYRKRSKLPMLSFCFCLVFDLVVMIAKKPLSLFVRCKKPCLKRHV